jgi:lysophospholipase L1-like esterase
MSVRITAALRSFIARKGVLFPVNHLVLAPLAFWLVLQIAVLDGVGNKRHLAVRLLALGCVAIFGYLSLVLGRRGNARLLPCFVAACIAGEIAMRAIGSFGTGSDLEWREPRPYFMFGGPTDRRIRRQMRLNDEGFRIEGEVAVPKPVDEIRIFVMGGSTVLALDGSLAQSIPGAMERELRAGGLPQARVYNFGVTSFVSGQELSLLVHRLADLAPDLVIAYDGGNDLFQPWYYDPRPGYPFNFVAWEEAIGKFSNTGTQSKTVASLAQDSALLQALVGTTERSIRNGLEDLRGKVGFASAPWKQTVVESYARNIAAMCRIAQANGALFAAFFQPLLPYSKSLDWHQVEMSGGDQMIASLREQRGQVPATVATQLAAVHAKAGCRFGDLSDFFENAPNTFVDVIHIDSQASSLIASRIARELLGWDALRSSAGSRR